MTDEFTIYCSSNCVRKAKRALDKKPLPFKYVTKHPGDYENRRTRRAQQRSNRRVGREISKANAQKAARKAKKVAETQEDKVG